MLYVRIEEFGAFFYQFRCTAGDKIYNEQHSEEKSIVDISGLTL